MEAFRTMLAPATRGNLQIWSDEQIPVGSDWRTEIDRELKSASVALLLVSERFLASGFITQIELPRILARHTADGMKLYWVPVRPALFDQSPFAGLQSPWRLNAPLLSLSEADQATAIRDICARLVEDAGSLIRLSEARHSRLQTAVQAAAQRWHIQLDRLLGSGETAVSYLGVMDGQAVVVKALVDAPFRGQLQDLEADLERTRGLRDACFSRLAHTMLDSDPQCLVLEYVDAPTVGAEMRSSGRPFGADEVLGLISGLAGALDEYHRAALLYGPMGTDDVFYDKERQLLRLSALSLSSRLAIGNAVNGGFPRDLRAATYLAPEQYRGEPYTQRTDQYALALLAVEMLLGQPPVVVRRAADLEEKKRFFDDPARCRGDLARLHPTLADKLLRMLCNRPEDRFASMAELAMEIEHLEPAAQALATQSYLERCMNQTAFYQAFYARFFVCCPRAGAMFRDLDLERQYRLLDQALQVLLSFAPANRIEAKQLDAIATAHGRWSVTAGELEQFCACLVDTLRDFSNEPPNVLAAWQAVLRPGVDYLSRRMGRGGGA